MKFISKRAATTLMCLLAGCSGSDPDFSGRFADGRLTVDLRASGEGYAGSFVLGGKTYPARANAEAGRLVGSFVDGKDEFGFSATRQGDRLDLQTGGTTYHLVKADAQDPLPTGEVDSGSAKRDETAAAPEPGDRVDRSEVERLAQQTAAATTATIAAPRFTRTHKHPAGIYFMYPDGWTVQTLSGGGVSLEPNDLFKLEGERAELFVVVGEEAQGIQRATDPRVLALMREFAAASFPYLREQGEPTERKIGDRDAVEIRWSGKTPKLDVEASMQVVLLGGFAIGAFTLTEKSRFEARHKTIQDVVRTFGYRKPKSDPRMVGQWRYSKTFTSGSFSSITERNLVLLRDGTCAEGGQMMAGMQHFDSGGDLTGTTSANTGGGADRRGRWRTEGKDIVLTWAGGNSERWGYYIEGESMLWQNGGTKKLWTRVR